MMAQTACARRIRAVMLRTISAEPTLWGRDLAGVHTSPAARDSP